MKIWNSELIFNECLLSLDYAKAFDRVSHEYLALVLNNLGLSTTTYAHRMIMSLYVNSTFKVWTEGGFTNSIDFKSGVKQGDPLSPLLFNLTLEPLMSKVRSKCAGITKYGVTKHINGYADDLLLFIKDSKDNSIALKILLQHDNASGSLLNKNKSFAISRGIPPIGFLPVFKGMPNPPTYLGILLDGDTMETQTTKMVKSLCLWKKNYHATLIGRINILNGYGLSMLYYHFYTNIATEKKKTTSIILTDGSFGAKTKPLTIKKLTTLGWPKTNLPK
jgi:hypothetical protein